MDEHRALMWVMNRVNKKAQLEFDKWLIRKGVDPNQFKLTMIGEYKDKVKLEYHGFDVDQAESE